VAEDVRSSQDALPAEAEREIRRLRFADPGLEAEFRDDYARRRINQFRLAFWVGLAIQVPISLRTVYLDDIPPTDARFWARLAVGVVPAVAGLRLTRTPGFARWSQHYMGVYVLLIGAVLILIFGAFPAGWARLMPYLVAACIMPRLRFRAAVLVVVDLIGWYGVVAVLQLDEPAPALRLGLPALAITALFILVGVYLIENSARRDFLLMRLLSAERETSERLLLNVVPAPIADKMKDTPERIAEVFGDVTVMFADIVDFTSNAARLSAEQTVDLLNEVFSSLDRLVGSYGVEKIKTIGDACMVVGGLSQRLPGHAQAVVAMAIEARIEIGRLRWPSGDPLVLRFGINTGPVVAGVIGTSKFSYDLLGDTVNVAGRMELHAKPGEILLTRSAYELVRDRYRFTRRRIDVKGKRLVEGFVLQPGPPSIDRPKRRAARPVSSRERSVRRRPSRRLPKPGARRVARRQRG
jgi:class 3 adenylate cyclase